jgi:hypothetical protein
VSGLPTTALPERRNLVAAAAELAEALRVEVGRLEQDAQRLEVRLPRFAADVRGLRARCARVLAAAEAVVGK